MVSVRDIVGRTRTRSWAIEVAASTSIELSSYVGGQWLAGPHLGLDVNPANPGDIVARVRQADAGIAVAAIRSAHAAAAIWRATPAPERGELLRRAAAELDLRAEEIGRDLTREEGKTIGEGIRETQLAASVLRYHAAQVLDPDGETYPSHRTRTMIFTRREPVGVVGVITPWNFPILIPAWKIGPALAFGNTVVWKPAELTPLTAVHLVRSFESVGLPPGVINLVLGRGSVVGETLATDPMVAAVTFTGSNAVGRALQLRAVAAGKKVQLELGGKNPAIVLADADLDLAVDQVARGAFLSAGQKCTATSRVIVERSIGSDFADRLAARAAEMQLGDPLDERTVVGPLVSGPQLEAVLGYVSGATAAGARAAAGGRRAGGQLAAGYFMRPTVLVGVQPDQPVVREEVFGPVAAILPASSFEEAIRLSNDTAYGLSASIFTNDLSRAFQFADAIRAGVVKINQETSGVELHVPFGGVKDSSSGSREQGKAARDFFTESKTVYVTTS